MSWVYDEDRIINSRDYSVRQGGSLRHLLIYPGFKGDPERDRLHEVFRFAHDKLRGALKSAAGLLAIGYSFRDDAINRVLLDAVRANPGLRILVLNPEWPDGLDHTMSKLSTVVYKFGNVFPHAARRKGMGAASSFFIKSARSVRVKCHAKGLAMLW